MRLSNFRTRSTRRGFTLVEVLVAAGLSMLIMLMVTTAFSRGMDTLSKLKSVGKMQQQLRSFEVAIRGDLEAEHFESKYGAKVSEQRLDKIFGTALTNDTVEWRPPTRGFFRIMNGNAANATGFVDEGTDPQNLRSTRATDHVLHFTVRRNATRGDKLFSAPMPAAVSMASPKMAPLSLSQMAATNNTMVTDWAEVCYFLDTQNPSGVTRGGTPLYGLYRRVRLIPSTGDPQTVSVNTEIFTPAVGGEKNYCQALSMSTGTSNPARPMNSPESVRDPNNRLGGPTSARVSGYDIDNIAREVDLSSTLAQKPPTGSDLLLSDVISFEIKADWDGPIGNPPVGQAGHVPLPHEQVLSYEFPFNVLPLVPATRNSVLAGRRVYDTWYDKNTLPLPAVSTPPTAAEQTALDDYYSFWLKPTNGANDRALPQPIRLRAVQIKIRVWDRKNDMARQITIIQDL